MTANVMRMTREEAFFLLDILTEKRDSLIVGHGEDARVTDEKSFALVNYLLYELINYSADHCRVMVNQTVPVYKELVENKDPATLSKIISLEISWDKAIHGYFSRGENYDKESN